MSADLLRRAAADLRERAEAGARGTSPVALALADLLGTMAAFNEANGRPLPEGPGTLMAVVRAVLREPEDGERP